MKIIDLLIKKLVKKSNVSKNNILVHSYIYGINDNSNYKEGSYFKRNSEKDKEKSNERKTITES